MRRNKESSPRGVSVKVLRHSYSTHKSICNSKADYALRYLTMIDTVRVKKMYKHYL